jgi:drug/metabolite transporter (DMT)-like permease
MPYLGLIFNALVWGLSWWPMRELQHHGLHPLWATMLFFGLGALLIGAWQPQAWALVRRTPALWVLALAAGGTNAAFNWAVSVGDVVRVVLLFYLMPLWAVLLAWWLLGERINRAGALRVALALAGAVLVLKPADGGWPRFDGLADWLALVGGMGFALNNVVLRKQMALPFGARALAMFMGGVILPGLLGLGLWSQGMVPAWPQPDANWTWMALGLGLAFFASNMALQFSAVRVPVHITSVIMLTEIVFATASSVAWGGAVLTWPVLAGGALILTAALLATRDAH